MSPSHYSHRTLNALTTFFFLLQTTLPPTTPLSFDFQGFKENDVKREGEAVVFRSEIQVTANTWDQTNRFSVGRVTCHNLLRVWEKSTRNLTDFTTSFSFIIHSDQPRFANGLAFFLADPALPLLSNVRQGGGLGLVDSDGHHVPDSTRHSFVAVEFDTFQNPWDPFGVHVGVNVNSMESNITEEWFPDIRERKTYNCTVRYNSSTLSLIVSFTGWNSTSGVTLEKTISYKVDLRDYLPESVIFGFSAATGGLFEVHILKSWSFNSSLDYNDENAPNDKPKKVRNIWVWVVLGSGMGLAVSLLGFICIHLWKRIKGRREENGSSVYDIYNMDDEFTRGTGPKSFCYHDLKVATSNFPESKKLGQGGFGGVYKGYLKEINTHVAIKTISRHSMQGIKEYMTEVKIISQLRHRNLVQLLGWCHKKNDLLLVYEYMPNGSLDSYLYNKNSKTDNSLLTWQARYNIALGLASALLYLQEEGSQCVLHRDIKSSNVMLDSGFNAKLGDFGLARLVSHEKGARTTLIAGTRGYIAPEYVFTGKAYKESDIYSFGVVLLEIASGRKAVDMYDESMESEVVISVVEWVWELYGTGKVGEAADPRLKGEFEERQMERLLVVGLWCTYPEHKMRPSVREVIKVLKFEAPLPVIPMTMPVPMYLPPSIKAVFSSLSASFWAKCDRL